MNYWQARALSATCYLLQVPVSADVVDWIDSSFCSLCLSSSPNAIDHCPGTVFTVCLSSSHLVPCLSPSADTIDCHFSSASLLKAWTLNKPAESLNKSKGRTPFFHPPLECVCVCSYFRQMLFLLGLPHFLGKKKTKNPNWISNINTGSLQSCVSSLSLGARPREFVFPSKLGAYSLEPESLFS